MRAGVAHGEGVASASRPMTSGISSRVDCASLPRFNSALRSARYQNPNSISASGEERSGAVASGTDKMAHL